MVSISPFISPLGRPHYEAGAGGDFDGSNDYMSLGSTPFAAGASHYVTIWFKRSAGSGDETFLDITGNALKIWVDDSEDKLKVSSIPTQHSIIGTPDLGYYANQETASFSTYEDGEWHCLMVESITFAGVALNVWIDGVKQADETTGTQNPLATPTTLYIGANNSGGDKFTGGMSEIHISNSGWYSFNKQRRHRRFTSSHRPTYLGTDGKKAFANYDTVPAPDVQIYLKGTGTGFNVNSGTLGNFSTTGTLGTPSTTPSIP